MGLKRRVLHKRLCPSSSTVAAHVCASDETDRGRCEDIMLNVGG